MITKLNEINPSVGATFEGREFNDEGLVEMSTASWDVGFNNIISIKTEGITGKVTLRKTLAQYIEHLLTDLEPVTPMQNFQLLNNE
ncbi:MAG: hypothetical protein ABWZ25_13620 [Chitinophagaceae bacterium]